MSIAYNFENVKGKYKMHRVQSLELADVYKALYDGAEYAADLDRWERREDAVRHCGTYLMFDAYRSIDGNDHMHRLAGANFCRTMLCPMCQWRRAQKLYGEMVRVWQYVFGDYRTIEFDASRHRVHPRLRAILLTLTVPNVPGYQLRDAVEDMQDGYHLLVGYPEWRAIKGYYRCLEVTYNASTRTYHPHYHVLAFVTEDYFTAGYVTRDRWLEIWRRCMRDDRITQVDVRALRGSTPDAMLKNLNEACKYTVKASDFLCGSMEQRMEIVETLDKSLHGVRRASFGGWIKAARAALKLEGALEHDYTPDPDEWIKVDPVWLHWASNLGDYVE